MENLLADSINTREGHSIPRLLVVEDDSSQARLIESMFRDSEFPADLTFAATIAQARSLIATLTFDLIITDYVLPDGKGTHLLPADPEKIVSPIVLMTGQGDEKVAVQAMKAGVVDYIVKTPETLRLLPKTVARILREWGNLLLRREMEAALNKKQQELEEQHDQLHDLFNLVSRAKKEWEQTFDCVSDLMLLVNESGEIRRFNRAVSELTGKTYRELHKSHIADIFGAWPLQAGELQHAASGRVFVINIYPLDITVKGSGLVVTAHDHTKLHKLNQELEETNQLLTRKGKELSVAYQELKNTQEMVLRQEKMATIGQLAAGVAHEINNPMGFILSNLTTLQKYLPRLTGFLQKQEELLAANPELAAELANFRRHEKIDTVLKDIVPLIDESILGADRVKKIVSDLKGVSRYDTEKPEAVDLNQLLDGTIQFVSNEIKYKAQLKRDYGDLPPLVCFPRQLGQVFTNLLVNASQAITDREGEIVVRTRSEGDKVCVSVTDNGCGIPEEVRKKIFDPFFTTKEPGKGTGLGLSISYQIIKNHAGECHVESIPGEGSTFTVCLPLGTLQQFEKRVVDDEWAKD